MDKLQDWTFNQRAVVLKELLVLRQHEFLPDDEHGYVSVEPFVNGRERGFTFASNRTVDGHPRRIEATFCEHRNSDEIRVYPFRWGWGDENHSEWNYYNLSRTFAPYDFTGAADFIIGIINGTIESGENDQYNATEDMVCNECGGVLGDLTHRVGRHKRAKVTA